MANIEVSYKPSENDLLFLQEVGNHRSVALFTGELAANTNIRARRSDAGLFEHLRTEGIEDDVRKYIISAGFEGVLFAGYHKIDHALITALVERWRPETHTFHFPIGEATVTLEDVQVLWGLPIDGPAVSGTWVSQHIDVWTTMCYDYLGLVTSPDQAKFGRVSHNYLVDCLSLPLVHTEEGYQQRARIWILALLGGHLFGDSRSYDVSLNYLEHIGDLSVTGRKSWGSSVLAYLYRNLCSAAEDKDAKSIEGPLMLLQFWAWERIPPIAPRIIDSHLYQNVICYARRWHHHLSNTDTPAHVLVTYRSVFTDLQPGQFIWRPYVQVLWQLPADCRNDMALWSYNGWLVHFHVVEPHPVHRVTRQFGFVQGIPNDDLLLQPARHSRIHTTSRTGGRNTNWVAKFHTENVQWINRHTNIHVFNGPEGVATQPDYMQWFYNRTVLFITNPGSANPINRYPEWGGIHQAQNEALRYMHDRAQGLINSEASGSQFLNEFVNIPEQIMGYGHNRERLDYGSQQFSFSQQSYMPEQPQPQPQSYQPQYASTQSGQYRQYGPSSSQVQPDYGLDMFDEMFNTPNQSFNHFNVSSSHMQPNLGMHPRYQNPDMHAHRSTFNQHTPIGMGSLGNIDETEENPDNQPDQERRRRRPKRIARRPRCGTE